jgi:hypothetical protein
MVKKAKEETEVVVEEVKKTTPSLKLRYTIETANGQYELKRPVGRVGITHFTIVTSAIPQSNVKDDDGNTITSPGDQKRFNDALENWMDKVLPSIYINGPYPVTEMPGEDVYALFLAMFTTVNFGGSELFRFVE